MSLTSPRKGPENIPAKTVIHVSYAVMIAAAYALTKNSAIVKNLPKINLAMSNPILTLGCNASCRNSAYPKIFL